MHVHRVTEQQAARTAAPNQSTTERAERPERPERAERPDAPGLAEVRGAPTREQIRAQIRDNIMAAQEAVQDANNEVHVVRGQLPSAPSGRGHAIQGPIFGDNVIPQQAVDIAQGFFFMMAAMVIGWPLARAFGRRVERGAQTVAVPPVLSEQLQRIEQAVDAMSIEIERISESQRFMAKLQNANLPEHAALPSGDRR